MCDIPFQLESDQEPEQPENVQVAVRFATTAGNFVPFTAVPKRYADKVVALVIVGDEKSDYQRGYEDGYNYRQMEVLGALC